MVVLDTEVVLRLYLREKGFESVARVLRRASQGRERALISILNVAEIWYILARKDPMLADRKIEALRSFGVKFVLIDDNSIWRLAAMIKSKRGLPLADAFAAATAEHYGERLLVGNDKHFRGLGLDVQGLPLR